MIRGVFYGTARHEGVTRQVSREDLARHETHTVSLARTSGHAADADAVVIDGGYRARNVRSVSRMYSGEGFGLIHMLAARSG